jgi:hypothetical protein
MWPLSVGIGVVSVAVDVLLPPSTLPFLVSTTVAFVRLHPIIIMAGQEKEEEALTNEPRSSGGPLVKGDVEMESSSHTTFSEALMNDPLSSTGPTAKAGDVEMESSTHTAFSDCNSKNSVVPASTGTSSILDEFEDCEESGGAENSAASSDEDLLAQADELLQLERLFEAVKLIRAVKDESLLADRHREVIASCEDIEMAIRDLLGDPDDASGWKKQSESHGKRDTIIYSIDDKSQLTCRIETPIETSLLVPLLAVLNETDLYSTWIPSWYMPSVGLRHSEKLQQASRANQIIKITVNIPWPISGAEIVLQTTAVDDIEDRNFIAIRLKSLRTGDANGIVPEPVGGLRRVPTEGAILLRRCPDDHPLLEKSKAKYDHHEHGLILLTFKICVRTSLHIFPTAFINFVTRTVIGTIWAMFITVAEEVRDGTRPVHQAAIDEKKEFYDWISERTDKVLDLLGQEEETKQTATTTTTATTANGEERETASTKQDEPIVAVENLLSGTF